MPGIEILTGMRAVADPAAIEAIVWPAGVTVVRIAPDDVLALGATEIEIAGDEHAIVEPETMYAGLWLDRDRVENWVASWAEWHLPHADGLSQGMVAGLPVKIWAERRRALVMVPASFAAELEDRL